MSSEGPATLKQIKKLYAVVRNTGRDPSEYVRDLKKERGAEKLTMISKREMSKIIDQFENGNESALDHESTHDHESGSALEHETAAVPEAVETGLSEIDEVFKRCLQKARDSVRKAKFEQPGSTVILEIAGLYLKIYYDEKGEKGRECSSS